MSGHTQSPWHVRVGRPLFADGSVNVIGDRGDYVCEVGSVGSKHADADSRLIAAAPDLLAALQTARDYVHAEIVSRRIAFAGYPEKWADEVADLAAIDAALASAKGAQP